MHVAQWIELNVGALGNEEVPKLAGYLKHQLQHWAYFAFYFPVSQHSGESLCVWLNGFSSVLGPAVMKGYQSWLDACSRVVITDVFRQK
jgi:hypothetical protein